MRKLPIVPGKLTKEFDETDKRSSFTNWPTEQEDNNIEEKGKSRYYTGEDCTLEFRNENAKYCTQRFKRNNTKYKRKMACSSLGGKSVTLIRQGCHSVLIKCHNLHRLKQSQVHWKALYNVLR